MLGFGVRAARTFGCGLVLASVLSAAGPAAAVTEDNFKLRTGIDIVELCSVGVDDPLFVAAIHMCHGIGAFFCPPEPAVTRNQAVADFLVWAKLPENATHLNDSPAAVVGRFLLTKYPCPRPGATGGGQ